MLRVGPVKRYGALVVTLVALIVVVPAVDHTIYGESVFRALLTLTMVAAVWAVSEQGRIFWAALAIGIPAVSTGWASDWVLGFALETAHLVNTLLFISIIMVLAFRSVLRRAEVDADTVVGGIAVYLLMVLFFALVAGLVEHLSPGSYASKGIPMTGSPESLAVDEFWSVMIYFSMVTITTLGYGDVTPIHGAALTVSSAEAMLGQLYVAVFIARLVALYTASARSSGDGAS